VRGNGAAGSGPRRCAFALEAAGQAAPCGETPAPRTQNRMICIRSRQCLTRRPRAPSRRSVLMTALPSDEWSLCVASGGRAPIEGVVGTQPVMGGSAELDRPRARAVARRGVRLRVRRTRRPRRGALNGHARPVMPAWSPTAIGRGRPEGGDVDHLAGSGGCFRGEALTRSYVGLAASIALTWDFTVWPGWLVST
jgi:hypothetical protein